MTHCRLRYAPSTRGGDVVDQTCGGLDHAPCPTGCAGPRRMGRTHVSCRRRSSCPEAIALQYQRCSGRAGRARETIAEAFWHWPRHDSGGAQHPVVSTRTGEIHLGGAIRSEGNASRQRATRSRPLFCVSQASPRRQTGADDFLAGAFGDVDPSVALCVCLGRATA